MTKFGFALLLCLSSTLLQAEDRSGEVDLAYSKLISMLPTEGQLLMLPYADNLQTYGDNLKVSRITDSVITGGKTLKVQVQKKGKNPWDSGVTAIAPGSIQKGDVLYLMFWARGHITGDPSKQTRIHQVSIQQASPPYQSVVAKPVVVDNQWQTFAIAGRANQDFGPNQAQFSAQIASAAHQLEFGPVFLLNLGKDVTLESLPFL